MENNVIENKSHMVRNFIIILLTYLLLAGFLSYYIPTSRYKNNLNIWKTECSSGKEKQAAICNSIGTLDPRDPPVEIIKNFSIYIFLIGSLANILFSIYLLKKGMKRNGKKFLNLGAAGLLLLLFGFIFIEFIASKGY